MDKRQSFYMFGGQSSTNVLQQKIQAAREGLTSEPELDEDQEKKYSEIIDVLLAGGYFRARITGLSRFDKVVGGMAWCITSSNADLDVDLFFQEEASIGQKIKLAENIIRALQRMKCPYRLDPQQLQGGANTSDFVNIYPVIQWLVKKVIETREETGDLMRMYSESQFAKEHKLPQESELFAKKPDAIAFLGKVADRYKPTRKFKKHGRRVFYATNKSEYERLQLALLEYGDITVSKGSQKESDDKNDDETSNLRKEMSDYVSPGRVNQDVLGNLIPENIQDIESQYDTETDDGGSKSGKLFGIRLHEQNLNKLEKSIAAKMQELKKLKESYEEITAQLEEIQSEYTAKVAYNQRIIEEIAKLDQLETPENSKQLQILKGLVALNENLKSQEQQFKQSCKKQLTEFKQKIDELQAEIPKSGKSEEDEAVEATYRKELDRLSQAKQFNSKKTRDLALVERKIDEVPSRTELTQYQRQFVELYETVASKETETRQYYNTYNQCEDTKVYLSKEVSILNSIHDNYKTAMASKTGKDQFLESLTSIIKSVNSTLEKSESKLNVEKDSKTKLTETYTALVEKERSYYKMTKEFLEECKKNEKMQTQLASY